MRIWCKKAAFFRSLGFTLNDVDVLEHKFRKLAFSNPVVKEFHTGFGTKYVIEGTQSDSCGLKAGDIRTVVHMYDAKSAAEVEFVTGGGKTVAVMTLTDLEFRPLGRRDILHARQMAI